MGAALPVPLDGDIADSILLMDLDASILSLCEASGSSLIDFNTFSVDSSSPKWDSRHARSSVALLFAKDFF